MFQKLWEAFPWEGEGAVTGGGQGTPQSAAANSRVSNSQDRGVRHIGILE